MLFASELWLWMVYCHAYFRNCTNTCRGVTAPRSVRTRLVAPVQYVHHGGVRICMAGVWKYHLCNSDLDSEVHYHASFRNPTPTVRGTMELPNLCTNTVWAPVRQFRLASCTDPYSSCTKMLFASEFFSYVVYYHTHFGNCTTTVRSTTGSTNFYTKAVLFLEWHTPTCIIGIVHLLYEDPRDLPICVQRRGGNPYGNVSQQAVQIPTAVVPKYLLRQCCPLGVVYCHVRYRNCTPTVRGATAPPSLCTKIAAPVR